jgi:hypothetical protein
MPVSVSAASAAPFAVPRASKRLRRTPRTPTRSRPLTNLAPRLGTPPHPTPSDPTLREESDPRYITNATDVKLRSFTTKVHKVDTVVSYRLADA